MEERITKIVTKTLPAKTGRNGSLFSRHIGWYTISQQVRLALIKQI
mgnify:CR=1 FL=1